MRIRDVALIVAGMGVAAVVLWALGLRSGSAAREKEIERLRRELEDLKRHGSAPAPAAIPRDPPEPSAEPEVPPESWRRLLEEFSRVLWLEDPGPRHEVKRRASTLGTEAADEVLAALASETDPARREALLAFAGCLGDPRMFHVLMTSFDAAGSVQVRRGAARGLRLQANEGVAPFADLRIPSVGDFTTRMELLWAIGESPGSAATPIVCRRAESPSDVHEQHLMYWALSQRNDPLAIPSVLRILEASDGQDPLLHYVIDAAGRLRIAAAIPTLDRITAVTRSESVRDAAKEAVRRITGR